MPAAGMLMTRRAVYPPRLTERCHTTRRAGPPAHAAIRALNPSGTCHASAEARTSSISRNTTASAALRLPSWALMDQERDGTRYGLRPPAGPSARPQVARGAARQTTKTHQIRRRSPARWRLARGSCSTFSAGYEGGAGSLRSASHPATLGLSTEPKPRLRSNGIRGAPKRARHCLATAVTQVHALPLPP